MTHLMFALMLSTLLATTGCIAVERDDPHHGWWDEHHGGEPYAADRAEREHRDWCARSYDRSCEGWYHR